MAERKKKQQKKKYKKHLSIRLAIGMVLILMLVQLLALLLNSLLIFFSSMVSNLESYAHVIYFIESSVDSGALLDAVHRGEVTDEFRDMEESLQDGYAAYEEDITEFLVFVGNREDGFKAVIDLSNDGDRHYGFLAPLTDISYQTLEACAAEADEQDQIVEGDVHSSMVGNTKALSEQVFGPLRSGTIPMFGYETDPCGEQVYYLTELDFFGVYSGPLISISLLALVTLVSTLVLLLLLILLTRRRVVKPLKKIKGSAVGFIKQTKEIENPEEWHYEPTKIRSRDEIQELSDTVEDMAHEIRRSVQEILSAAKEKERVGVELQLASGIQKSMLPGVFPAFPERSDFDIFASMKPAKEVGGDFYDFFLIDDDRLFLAIADVSGKGIPASLFMMSSKLILSSLAKEGLSPAEILSRANNQIADMNDRGMFVTAWVGILDLRSGILAAANAGHEYPAVYSPSKGFCLLKDRHGLVLGEFQNMKYYDYEIPLAPGGAVFVYTDGVAEANDHDEKMFGTDRIINALNQKPEGTPEEILEHMDSAVKAFTGDAEQFDDITMLCVRWRGPEEDGQEQQQNLSPDEFEKADGLTG